MPPRLVAWSGVEIACLSLASLGVLPASVTSTGEGLAAVYGRDRTGILVSAFHGGLAGSGALLAAVGVHRLASAASLATGGPWSLSDPVSASAPLGMTLWVGCVPRVA